MCLWQHPGPGAAQEKFHTGVNRCLGIQKMSLSLPMMPSAQDSALPLGVRLRMLPFNTHLDLFEHLHHALLLPNGFPMSTFRKKLYDNAHMYARCLLSAAPPWPPSMFSQ